MKGHFVTLIEVHFYLIGCNPGHICGKEVEDIQRNLDCYWVLNTPPSRQANELLVGRN